MTKTAPKPTRRLRSPINWFGGKGRMTAKLLPLLPEHHIYVEPFGGGGSLLFAKEPSPVEVYNDVNSDLVNFVRVLRDGRKARALRRLLNLTPYSREERNDSHKRLLAKVGPDVRRAADFFICARQGFGGHVYGNAWGYVVTATTNGMSQRCASWISCIDGLPELIARLRMVQIEHRDGLDVIDRFDTEGTCFYLDPPYVHSTRKSGEYQDELADDDHRALVERLLRIEGMALLSGYCNPIYQPLERAGWRVRTWSAVCSAAGYTRATGIRGTGSALRRQPRTECVWISPRAQQT